MIKNYLFLLTLFTLLFNYKASSTEALFQEDFDKLPIVEGKGYLNEERFDTLFPKRLMDETIDHTSFVGQIVDDEEYGVGSGILYTIKLDNNKLVGTCISSLHIFCLLNSRYGNALQINRNLSFIIGAKQIGDDPNLIGRYGILNIEEVLYTLDSEFKKDICLLRGEIILDPGFDYNDFYHQFTTRKMHPRLMKKNPNILEVYHTCFLYHYPMGKKELRRNRGLISSETLHHTRTLPGSSGAPIFVRKKKILGIHIGNSKPSTDKFIRYYPLENDANECYDLNTSLNDENRYEIFTKNEYKHLL
tara:strand:- start:494 stop:1405 length:912 start_codon:yes stop_codon:yes gene_type:complete